MTFVSQTASTSNSDLFTALGIDWRLLIFQIIAFLILVFLLGKFVYPWLIKQVDDRQAAIKAAAEAAAEAKADAEKNQAEVAALLEEARKSATDIVNTAKLESSEMVAESEKKARSSAEQILAEAHDQITKDVASVRTQLYNDTLELVGLATEKVVRSTHIKKADGTLIAKAVKESK